MAKRKTTAGNEAAAAGERDRASRARAAVRKRAPRRDPVETFPNPNPGRDYEIDISAPEWTALCPITGQPDFATIRITYVPDELCLELKSLKLYLHSFRNRGVFHEAVTNEILDHLVKSCAPRRLRVLGDFRVRGGISTRVTAEHPAPGAFPPPPERQRDAG
jgi:7-cyano-7-deazaguanine reductase